VTIVTPSYRSTHDARLRHGYLDEAARVPEDRSGFDAARAATLDLPPRTTSINSLLSARLIAGGIKSLLPVRKTYTGTGGSDSARYCYATWLRHLVTIADAVPGFQPKMVAELGPGDSLGLGLAALLSGVERYTALDVLAHTSVDANLGILGELVTLFRQRSDIPGDAEFPGLYPRVAQHEFPAEALARLGLSPDTSDGRIDAIRRAIRASADGATGESAIRYLCPWPTATVTPGTIDLIVTQAVLQDMDHWAHDDVLEAAFAAMARWLRPGGVMSHQVNLAFPDTEHWNDHWAYGDLTWRVIRGKRPYYVNRVPASEYLRLCSRFGFDVVDTRPVRAEHEAPRSAHSRRFRGLPESDYTTCALHFVAVKR
jgi:hypothetical protein